MGLTFRSLRDQEEEAKAQAKEPMWKSDNYYYHTADRKRVVLENDPEAAFLLIHKGGEMLESEAIRHGLVKPEPVVKATEKPADKATAKPVDKARKSPANK